MSIELEDLVPSVEDKVNGPGGSFITASSSQWVTSLANGFWDAKNAGWFAGYRESDGAVSNVAGGDDLTRELQQVIVLVTARAAVTSKLLGLTTRERASAAPGLETEFERSAALMRDILKQYDLELQQLRVDLLGTRYRTEVGVIDSVAARDRSIRQGTSRIVR